MDSTSSTLTLIGTFSSLNPSHEKRINKIIIEASEQSNRLKVPSLDKLTKFDTFLKSNQNTNIIFGDLNTDKRFAANAGTSTSALGAGGIGPSANMDTVESWNGTSWTEVADLNTARRALGGFGASNTSALAAGGYVSTAQSVTEIFNGSAWTESGDLNTARYGGGTSQGASTTGSGIFFGGEKAAPSPGPQTEDWNGASWSEVADLSTGRGNGIHGAGSATLGLAAGGETATAVHAGTEEWSGSSVTSKVLTD